jgi:hypothetical protein
MSYIRHAWAHLAVCVCVWVRAWKGAGADWIEDTPRGSWCWEKLIQQCISRRSHMRSCLSTPTTLRTQWHQYRTSFFILGMGWDCGCCTKPLLGLLFILRKQTVGCVAALVQCKQRGEKDIGPLWGKPVPLSLCSPHVPYGLPWYRTQATAWEDSDEPTELWHDYVIGWRQGGGLLLCEDLQENQKHEKWCKSPCQNSLL